MAYLELIEHCMQRNEKLDKMRSKLHVEALKMLHELNRLEKDEPSCVGNLKQRGLLQLLNYLVVDYFDWYGYTNTLKTFSIETGKKTRPKPREKLQRELGGNFDNIELPILLQMLLKETSNDTERLLDHTSWQHMPTSTKNRKKSTGSVEALANEWPSKRQEKHKASLVAKKMPAKQQSLDDAIKIPVLNLFANNDIRKPQTKVNVRQSMAANDAQRC